MSVIVIPKRKQNLYGVPAGGEILWYGVAANVPVGWEIDAACQDVFVRGAGAGGASDTPQGANSHTHTNPGSTGTVTDHTHTLSNGGTSGASGTVTVYPSGSLGSAPAGHDHAITGTAGAGGSHSHTLSSTGSAAHYPPFARLYWIRATVESAVPVGGVVMLDANLVDRPVGFELCNGNGGTPDLRSKFVYGASADAHLGATGGASTHTHANPNTGSGGSHTHALSLNVGNADSDPSVSGYAGTNVSSGGHSHSASGTTASDAAHTHTLSNTGSGNNLPAHLKLYFVMRTT